MTALQEEFDRGFIRLGGAAARAVVALAMWLASDRVTVAQSPAITTDWSAYLPGEDIVVAFKNTPGKPKDWVGLYPEGAVPGPVASTRWYYVDGTHEGVSS